MTRRTLLQALSASALPSFVMSFVPRSGDLRITPVPIEKVTIDDAFWLPKRRVWRDVTIHDCLSKFEVAFANFDRVRDGKTGGHVGAPWFDGLIYEMIRGIADFLRSEPSAELESEVDSLVDRIVAAADRRPDGYVNTYTQLQEPGHEWGLHGGLEVWQHEFYNAGALVDAGVHYYRATKKSKLLGAAVRLANTICDLISDETGRNLVPSHELPEEAMLSLYELLMEYPDLQSSVTGASNPQRYLDLAEFWIENRGRNCLAIDWSNRDRAGDEVRAMKDYDHGRPSWGDYAQDRTPILEQTEVVGHAVRSTLLCSAVAAVGRVNEKPSYKAAATRLWENMVFKRMHITGGVGASANEEAFGADYQLPNDAYLETCAAVGAGFFHANMHQLTGHGRYADELERVLFNGVLCGVSVSGDRYTYQNPLVLDESRTRWSWHECPCCPPMFLKIMGAMPSYLYSTDSDSLYVNQFVGSRAEVKLGGRSVQVVQTTEYPWNGAVRLAVETDGPAKFSLKIRVPGWASKPRLKVNGLVVEKSSVVDGYVTVSQVWKSGDVVEFELDMPIRRVKADPHVTENQGNVAVVRGPLVYCFESCDSREPSASPRLAAGEPVLEAWEDRLGGIVAIKTGPHDAYAIPFFANGNRGPVKMQVWLPASI
ncbi:MAG: glycoside hydrolase family 127 protein [Armatimonadetes bacterium]|nr:glycoside hydrolase family 127 protein [Armatimonadota bacterium]